MAEFKFSHDYKDKELDREVKANEPVEMTVTRADEIVKTIRSKKIKGYENFGYERLDKDDNKEDKFEREAAKARLEELEVEFKGNASNDELKKLLEEHDKEDDNSNDNQDDTEENKEDGGGE